MKRADVVVRVHRMLDPHDHRDRARVLGEDRQVEPRHGISGRRPARDAHHCGRAGHEGPPRQHVATLREYTLSGTTRAGPATRVRSRSNAVKKRSKLSGPRTAVAKSASDAAFHSSTIDASGRRAGLWATRPPAAGSNALECAQHTISRSRSRTSASRWPGAR